MRTLATDIVTAVMLFFGLVLPLYRWSWIALLCGLFQSKE